MRLVEVQIGLRRPLGHFGGVFGGLASYAISYV